MEFLANSGFSDWRSYAVVVVVYALFNIIINLWKKKKWYSIFKYPISARPDAKK